MGTTRQGASQFQYLVESICQSLDGGRPPKSEDMRDLLTQIQENLQSVLPGGNWLAPGGATASSANAPSGVGFAVNGANGSYAISMTNPSSLQGGNVWHEVSYCALRSFTRDVTTLPPTTGTTISVQDPGSTYFFRLRSSFDLKNWSPYQLASTTALSAGKVSSAATSDAGAFNQTNFGVVTSSAVGAAAAIHVQGASGPLTNLVAQKGPTQTILPGATIIGVIPGTDQFVGYKLGQYVLRYTLADLLADDEIVPIGKVSVVETGVPVLPVITPIISGGHIIGTSWTPGSGLSAPPDLTVTDPGGPGNGAIVVCTGVEAGGMTGVQVLNGGEDYDGSTLITPSGGIFPGTEGGGTAIGGNGGRLTAV